MTTYIALLRAVNVGGHQPVAMANLREFLTILGFAHVRSLLQSGNLIFQSDGRTSQSLETLLRAEVEKHLKLRTDFFVRSLKEWKAILDGNPFTHEAKRDPGHLLMMALSAAPDASAVESLRSAINGPEIIHASGRHLYLVYPAGVGRSRLTNVLIEKKLGVRGTARNWNTVQKLAQAASQGK